MFSLQLYLVVVLPASLVLGLGESPSFGSTCYCYGWPIFRHDLTNFQTLIRIRILFPLGRLPVNRKCSYDNFRRQLVHC
jgi:hypothetical protein